RERRDDDFVAGADAEGHKGQVQRDRAIRCPDPVGVPGKGSELSLESIDERSPRRDPGRPERLVDVGDFFLPDRGAVDRNHVVRSRIMTVSPRSTPTDRKPHASYRPLAALLASLTRSRTRLEPRRRASSASQRVIAVPNPRPRRSLRTPTPRDGVS